MCGLRQSALAGLSRLQVRSPADGHWTRCRQCATPAPLPLRPPLLRYGRVRREDYRAGNTR